MTKLVSVSFNLEMSSSFTNEEIEEWIRYKISDKHEIRIANPLADEDFNPFNVNIDIN